MKGIRKNGHLLPGLPRLNAVERTYALLSPVAFAGAQIYERITGARKEESRWRRGYLPQCDTPSIWIHGASAGEMAAGRMLAAALNEAGLPLKAAYTCANRAGIDYIRRREAGDSHAVLSPWDTVACVNRAFERWRPRALFLVETELWPMMIFGASRRGIPAFSVSARIFPADLSRYRAVRPFISRTLSRLTAILTQDEVERERFLELGADPAKCIVAGNLKYAGQAMPHFDSTALRYEVGVEANEPIVVFGSLHGDEIAALAGTIAGLVARNVRVVVAPRHPSSAHWLAIEAERQGWRFVRRSLGTRDKAWQLLLLDTIGELQRFYSIARCAVVGGGFGRHGGHNPFEPVMAGAPVVFGLNFDHFSSEARALANATPEASFVDALGISGLLAEWLGDEQSRRVALERQRSALPDGTAIADRYVTLLRPWLEKSI